VSSEKQHSGLDKPLLGFIFLVMGLPGPQDASPVPNDSFE
jgi:hypothetical protein